jgi:hypothetical protein
MKDATQLLLDQLKRFKREGADSINFGALADSENDSDETFGDLIIRASRERAALEYQLGCAKRTIADYRRQLKAASKLEMKIADILGCSENDCTELRAIAKAIKT